MSPDDRILLPAELCLLPSQVSGPFKLPSGDAVSALHILSIARDTGPLILGMAFSSADRMTSYASRLRAHKLVLLAYVFQCQGHIQSLPEEFKRVALDTF